MSRRYDISSHRFPLGVITVQISPSTGGHSRLTAAGLLGERGNALALDDIQQFQ